MTKPPLESDPDRRHFRTPPRSVARRAVKESTSLRILHEVLGLEHLHYGLWDGEPLDRDGLQAAQERYLDRLVELIPGGVESILDVGCGSGAFSRRLAEAGFEVEGLSPDPYQQRLYHESVGRPFHLGRFQEFEPPHPYDLVLMSESAQYVWLDSLFPAVCRTAPGGHLLLADYFRSGETSGKRRESGHPVRAFFAAAERHGLELEVEEDVTEQVLPTLELGSAWMERHVLPALQLAGEVATRRYPLLSALGSRLLRKRLAGLDELGRTLDPEVFRRTKRYLILRFRVAS